MKAITSHTLIGEVLHNDLANIIPPASEVLVLEDGEIDGWVQLVVVQFPEPNYAWLSDGRVIAVDWQAFEARTLAL